MKGLVPNLGRRGIIRGFSGVEREKLQTPKVPESEWGDRASTSTAIAEEPTAVAPTVGINKDQRAFHKRLDHSGRRLVLCGLTKENVPI